MSGEAIPEAEYVRILDYFQRVGELLCIHWDIGIHREYVAGEDFIAKVVPTPNRHMATIYIGEDWKTIGRDEKREACVHELLHILNSKVDQLVEDVIAGALPKGARKMMDAYVNADEQRVDRTAYAVARLMPKWR